MNSKPGTIFPALAVTGGAILLILASAGAHSGHDDVADGVNAPAFLLAKVVAAPRQTGAGVAAPRDATGERRPGGGLIIPAVMALDLNKDGVIDADGTVHRTRDRAKFDKVARQELAG